jgi:hypothetical protein
MIGTAGAAEPGVVPVNEWHSDELEANVDTARTGTSGRASLRRSRDVTTRMIR